MPSALQWSDFIEAEKKLDYYPKVMSFLESERAAGKSIYPEQKNVFSAFELTPFDEVKVVILGQDPYHGPNQAHGLSFSVLPDVKIPPSLVNIYKELAQDIDGFTIPSHGFLGHWAEQGVLLLNTVLTVEQGKAHSHSKIGWETFTDHMIDKIAQHHEGIVFLLWGAHAQKKGRFIDRDKHHVLTSPHPSPLSAHRGFLGCQHFSQTNTILKKQNQRTIDWAINPIDR
ncbi:uracil-DNA glycosylase [uncultured Vibrio sp.]|uniref:uracil-DNA glycosylase n=1 Tax=uncultured Vibrio sp. TaxID=114054 RepID=UPI0009215121|nr:uracil-DNA glycosylase [uncultured Vibrio sp.]OIQ25195.1 MAG: uracil-DNA glycosylase [Vibrio sp. MedPE-SWchi]